jgi:hypothetical protein
MNDLAARASMPESLEEGTLESYKRTGERLTIVVKITEELFVTITLDGVLLVLDRGWHMIGRPLSVVDGVPVRLRDLEARCRRASNERAPFSFELPADNGESGLEVVARGLSVRVDRVESPDEPRESVY